jgi:hypothetical protein
VLAEEHDRDNGDNDDVKMSGGKKGAYRRYSQ